MATKLLTIEHYLVEYKKLYKSTTKPSMDIVESYLKRFTATGKHLMPLMQDAEDWNFPEDRHEREKHIHIINNLINMKILFVPLGNFQNDWKTAFVCKDGEFSRSLGLLK